MDDVHEAVEKPREEVHDVVEEPREEIHDVVEEPIEEEIERQVPDDMPCIDEGIAIFIVFPSIQVWRALLLIDTSLFNLGSGDHPKPMFLGRLEYET
ncbi:unnamed protein product [Lactuca virosa]|uniref:Uncharacterized protein n=1 Tax=Lactuca virosa TaxID=75947 RepID=A0AAU9LVX1_9ASTR|nr:unnamed protein product [Lactuca virosa]